MRNDRLDHLAEFPFRRLAGLLAHEPPPAGPTFDLALGEPRHAPPALLAETVAANAHLWNRYPPVHGTPEFRAAVAAWLTRRFDLPPSAVDPDRHVVPLAGTKEGLYLLPSLLVPSRGTAGRADAGPGLCGLLRRRGHGRGRARSAAGHGRHRLPAGPRGHPGVHCSSAPRCSTCARRPTRKVPWPTWTICAGRCASPAGTASCWPSTNATASSGTRAPPPGALEAALAEDGCFDGVVVFHSLSKRSSAAGLRSGFVAGDADILARLLRLRAYASPVQPLPLLAAATALWQDEAHVEDNRARYRAKFDTAQRRLGNRFGFYRPAGGFFLWLDVGDGEAACRRLWREGGIRVLPGGYLSVGAPGAERRLRLHPGGAGRRAGS